MFEFFQQCLIVLRKVEEAEVHVTLKAGEPYASWKIGHVCREATGGQLELCMAHPFDPSLYEGYAHRRTQGFKEGESAAANAEIGKHGLARTHIFQWAKEMKDGWKEDKAPVNGQHDHESDSSKDSEESHKPK